MINILKSRNQTQLSISGFTLSVSLVLKLLKNDSTLTRICNDFK